MEQQCRICERYFSTEEIKSGESVPTFRGQHYRLVMIDGIVHKFQSVKNLYPLQSRGSLKKCF